METHRELSNYMRRVLNTHPPLNSEEQKKLIKLAQEGDEEALDDLIVTNLRLVVNIAKSFYFPEVLTLDDLVSEGSIGLRRAILAYNLNKPNNLAGFAYTYIRWRILNFLRDYEDTKGMIRIDPSFFKNDFDMDNRELNNEDYIDKIPSPVNYDFQREWEIQEDLKFFLSFLSERSQIILITSHGLLGFGAYSLPQVAKIVPKPISRERARQLKNESIAKLKLISTINSKKELAEYETYPLVNLDWLTERIKSLKIISFDDGDNGFALRYRRKYPNHDLTCMSHKLNLAKKEERKEFYEKFAELIEKDAREGYTIRALAYKYNCSPQTIETLAKKRGFLNYVKRRRRKKLQNNKN